MGGQSDPFYLLGQALGQLLALPLALLPAYARRLAPGVVKRIAGEEL
jgi:hypothetical protein